jgi:serine/threonine protein kinase
VHGFNMATIEAEELGKLAVRLGLISDSQLIEVLDEAGPMALPDDITGTLVRKGSLTNFQADKLRKGDLDGYFLGEYRLLYKIASGSFGRVYRADDPRTGAAVAIKVLRRRWTDDANKINLFEREGKVGMRLLHPNIVQILGVSCDRKSNQFYIVMEFVEGGNLRDLLAVRKKLSVVEAIRILEESAAGLADAYAHGLTHRDIKPSNILISSQGVAKLVDFGLTELTSHMGYSVIEDENINVDRTVDYAGLERATDVNPGDPRSDIFFLGSVLYEMLSGRPALPPTKDRRVRMQKHRFEQILPLARDEVQAPGSVFQLLDRMLALDPALRFQTPAQLHEAIRAVQAELSGGPSVNALTPQGVRTVFVIEKKERLQERFREKFKSLGFRVLVSIDAGRALKRYQQQPFDGLLLNVATVGAESLETLGQIQRAAATLKTHCACIVLLSDEQANLRARVPTNAETAVLMFPLKKGEIETAIEKLLPTPPK